MRFGVNTLIWSGHFDREQLRLLPSLKEAGFDGIEIARFNWDGFPAAEVKSALDEHGLKCTICSALTGTTSLASEDAGSRADARKLIEDTLRAGAAIGAETVAGPFVAPVGHLPGRRRTEDEWKRVVEGLQAVAPVLEETGVKLAVEPLNRFETYFLYTVEDGVRLCEEVGHSQVGLLVDTFHSNIEEKHVAEAYRIAAKHLFHVHTCENDRGIPGTGHIPWPAVVEALRDAGYDDWCVIESFGFRIPEIAAAACIWRDIAPSPESIAFQGLSFLRRQFSR